MVDPRGMRFISCQHPLTRVRVNETRLISLYLKVVLVTILLRIATGGWKFRVETSAVGTLSMGLEAFLDRSSRYSDTASDGKIIITIRRRIDNFYIQRYSMIYANSLRFATFSRSATRHRTVNNSKKKKNR